MIEHLLVPDESLFLNEVIIGLSHSQKKLPAKFLYDKRGSEIFEDICELPSYYPTRAEREILKQHAKEMADLIGDHALIIEPGSGNGEKIRYILPKLTSPRGYMPIEISIEILQRMTKELGVDFPNLKVTPVCADFTNGLNLPLSDHKEALKRVIFFPGSTIGNMDPKEALGFLYSLKNILGHGGGLLIGVDLKKDGKILKLAYDDPEGVTANFNLNLLSRLNREADATFNLKNFKHEAFYNEILGRVEMHLVSLGPQFVKVNKNTFRFEEGESIHTESSYKYSTEEFSKLAAQAGFEVVKHWKDSKGLFCVYFFEQKGIVPE